ncbi:MAG: outer membrane protein transport protein [Legionella sp.]|jgi:long-subunit fatty acid transport protein
MTQSRIIKTCLCLVLLSSHCAQASFIESSIGTAIINDATATYYNPAALLLLKDTQLIGLGALGTTQSHFDGLTTYTNTGFTQTGSSQNRTNFFLPSLYLAGAPSDRFRLGLAVIGNNFNSDLDGHSILRYTTANNTIEDMDFVPAIGFKVNKLISLGASVTYSHAHFLFKPIIGFPDTNLPDSHSVNDTSADAWGGDIGILITPSKKVTMGFNYRSAITYNMSGKSIFSGIKTVSSYDYGFNFWTPARSVFSINYFQTPALAYIATLQYIQWSIFKNVVLHDIASPAGIVKEATVPYNFHDAWVTTLGTNYRATTKLVLRAAATYSQRSSNGQFQIDTGDSLALGVSVGYTLMKNLIVDASYSHLFFRDQPIHVQRTLNLIDGTNAESIDAMALKLTWNI